MPDEDTVEALLATTLACKRPALVTTTFAKPHLNCDLHFVMKSSRKRPRPLLGLPNWTFPLFLISDHSESFTYKSML